MRKFSLCFLTVLLLAVTGMATTLSFTSPNPTVKYAINDSTGFYMSNSALQSSVDTVWSMPFFGGFWQMAATPGNTYSDAGIVLLYDTPVRLGDLRSVDITADSNISSHMNLNLWLDTGGDGTFFNFAGNQFTNIDGDTYGGSSGTHFDLNSVFYLFVGQGAGQQVTLAQLQAGTVNGIDENTRTSFWVGITNYNGGVVNRVDVTAVPEPASLTLLGAGLAGLATRLRKRFSA